MMPISALSKLVQEFMATNAHSAAVSLLQRAIAEADSQGAVTDIADLFTAVLADAKRARTLTRADTLAAQATFQDAVPARFRDTPTDSPRSGGKPKRTRTKEKAVKAPPAATSTTPSTQTPPSGVRPKARAPLANVAARAIQQAVAPAAEAEGVSAADRARAWAMQNRAMKKPVTVADLVAKFGITKEAAEAELRAAQQAVPDAKSPPLVRKKMGADYDARTLGRKKPSKSRKHFPAGYDARSMVARKLAAAMAGALRGGHGAPGAPATTPPAAGQMAFPFAGGTPIPPPPRAKPLTGEQQELPFDQPPPAIPPDSTSSSRGSGTPKKPSRQSAGAKATEPPAGFLAKAKKWGPWAIAGYMLYRLLQQSQAAQTVRNAAEIERAGMMSPQALAMPQLIQQQAQQNQMLQMVLAKKLLEGQGIGLTPSEVLIGGAGGMNG